MVWPLYEHIPYFSRFYSKHFSLNSLIKLGAGLVSVLTSVGDWPKEKRDFVLCYGITLFYVLYCIRSLNIVL
jgi:hypothetical protein